MLWYSQLWRLAHALLCDYVRAPTLGRRGQCVRRPAGIASRAQGMSQLWPLVACRRWPLAVRLICTIAACPLPHAEVMLRSLYGCFAHVVMRAPRACHSADGRAGAFGTAAAEQSHTAAQQPAVAAMQQRASEHRFGSYFHDKACKKVNTAR